MKKNVLKRTGLVMAIVTSMTLLAGCNKKLDVSFQYNADDYIKMGDYKNLSVEVDKTSIEDRLINKKIESDLSTITSYNEVTRPAQDLDKVLLNLTATIGGEQYDGFSASDYELILGKDQFSIDGITDQVYGMNPGETKIYTTVVPDTMTETPDLIGKRIVYEITLTSVAAPVVPMLTDAYAKENFGFDTFEEYRQSIKSELQESIDSDLASAVNDKVMAAVQKNVEVISVPEDYLTQKKDSFNTSISFYATMYGMTVEEYCQDRYGVSLEEYAKNSIVQEFIMQKIIQLENISIDEYTYKGDLESFANTQGFTNKDSFVEKYGKDVVVKGMALQKATNVVIDSANITYK